MIAVSTELDAVLDGISQTVAVDLTIDLPVPPYVGFVGEFTQALVSIALDTQNQTELPDEVRDTSGFGTLGGSLVLAGPIGPFQQATVADYLNPDNPDSPLYRQTIKGAAVVFDLGAPVYGQIAPQYARQFTGVIATVSLDHENGTATLGLVDHSDSWGEVGSIPNAADGTVLTAGYVMAALVNGVNDGAGPGFPVTLDNSLTPLTVVPEIETGTKVVDALQQIAAAEFGYFRVQEDGSVAFSNRVTLANQAVQQTIRSSTALKVGITTEIGGTTQYDAVKVPYTAWTAGDRTAIFTLADVKVIPRHQTVVWEQPLDTLARNVDTTPALLLDGHDPLAGGSFYRVSSDVDGLAAHPGVTFFIRQITSAMLRISVTNSHNADAYFTTPSTYSDFDAGSAGSGLWIGGIPLTPSEEAFVTVPTPADGADPPKATLTLESNPYWQTAEVAETVALHVFTQVAVAIRDYAGTAIVPNPRTQVGDLDKIEDPHRSLINEYVRVFGKHLSIEFPPAGTQGGTYEMSLDVRPLGPPGAWLLGIPGRSELGSGADEGTAYLYG